MEKRFIFLAFVLLFLGCKSKNAKLNNRNLFEDWNIIYLDYEDSRFVIKQFSDSLTISKFSYNERIDSSLGFVRTKVLDSIHYLPINKEQKSRLVENTIAVFKNPIPYKSYTTHHAGQASLCINKDDSYLYYSFPTSDNLQMELIDIMSILQEKEKSIKE